MGNPNAPAWPLEKTGKKFIEGFDSFNAERGEGLGMNWHYHANISVETMVDTLITLSVEEEYFTGGAHGGTGKYFVNINPVTNQEVTLEDFLRPGAEEALRIAGRSHFEWCTVSRKAYRF